MSLKSNNISGAHVHTKLRCRTIGLCLSSKIGADSADVHLTYFHAQAHFPPAMAHSRVSVICRSISTRLQASRIILRVLLS